MKTGKRSPAGRTYDEGSFTYLALDLKLKYDHSRKQKPALDGEFFHVTHLIMANGNYIHGVIGYDECSFYTMDRAGYIDLIENYQPDQSEDESNED